MTGGEISAAAVAAEFAKKAGDHLTEQSKSVNHELLDAAKDDPAFRHAATQYAKRVAIKQAILTKFYEPIAKKLGIATEYFQGEFEADMAEKLASVPEHRIIAPKPSIAAPAMTQLAFSLDEPDLKEMYLSLLATASDSHTAAEAHPAFVEVIKQLSAEETIILNTFQATTAPQPVVCLRQVVPGRVGTGYIVYRHILDTVKVDTSEPLEVPDVAAWVDNWIRLGLVEVSYTHALARVNAYVWVHNRPEYKRVVAAAEGPQTVQILRGVLSVTDFGMKFGRAVGVVMEEADLKMLLDRETPEPEIGFLFPYPERE